jgi:hypothetical protein
MRDALKRAGRWAAVALRTGLGVIGWATGKGHQWYQNNREAVHTIRQPMRATTLDHYAHLPPETRRATIETLLKQYDILQSEKRMLQQITNAVLAFLVAGIVAALVAFAQVQATIAGDIADVGLGSEAFDAARRSANVIVALIPPAMLAGGIVLMSLHARTRKISFFCAYLEHVINSTAASHVRAMGWESVSLALLRGRGWNRYVFVLGVLLTILAFIFVWPVIDHGNTPIDPPVWLVVNAFLLLSLLGAAVSHWIDQIYYARTIGRHFGPDWTSVDAS